MLASGEAHQPVGVVFEFVEPSRREGFCRYVRDLPPRSQTAEAAMAAILRSLPSLTRAAGFRVQRPEARTQPRRKPYVECGSVLASLDEVDARVFMR